MKIIKYIEQNKNLIINEAVKALENRGLIVYPTETVYALGTDATNQASIDKLVTYKERMIGKAIPIGVSNIKMAEEYAHLNETAKDLWERFLPGPITIVSQGLHKLAKNVESETGTIGLRLPDNQIALDIIKSFEKPVTSTSTTQTYQKRAYSIDDILTHTSKKQQGLIDLVIDCGELPHNEPSTVIDTTLNSVSVLRQGNVKLINSEEFISNSVEETIDFAAKIIDRYRENIGHKAIILALQGDMGAGKTHFAKGIGRYLKINETISSPTFTLEEEYQYQRNGINQKFIHIDTWRMLSNIEFEELEFEKRIDEKDIIVIEWAEKAYDYLKDLKDVYIIWLKFQIIDENTRKIIFSNQFINK